MSRFTSPLAGLDRRLIAAVALAAVALAALGGTGAYLLVQNARPTTVSFDLRDGVREVPLDRRVTLRFSRPVATDRLRSALTVVPAVEANLTSGDGGTTYVFTPTHPWADLTRYTVAIAADDDGHGHRLGAATRHFTTTIVPRVTSLSVEGGATLAEGAELPLRSRVRAVFNSPMDQVATRLTVNARPLDGSWAADGLSTLVDLAPFPVGPLAFTLAAGARDSTGRPADAAWTLRATAVFVIDIRTTPLPAPALVQVPNEAAARDQSGLQAADLVFEANAEGGIPRMTALFTRVPDTIGNVRSGRLVSFRLTRHYHGELFLSGLSEGSMGRYLADPVPAQFDQAGVFYRTSSRPSPHNLYLPGAAVLQSEQRAHLPAYQLRTGPATLPPGPGGADLTVDEHRTAYHYDVQTGTYLKTTEGHLMADANIGQPLHVRMVVVMHTNVVTTGIIEDSGGAHGLDYDLDSGGAAEFYLGGQKAIGTWSSPDRSSPLVFKLTDGTALNVPAGLVWVDVVH